MINDPYVISRGLKRKNFAKTKWNLMKVDEIEKFS
jgi:hypothetical protein